MALLGLLCFTFGTPRKIEHRAKNVRRQTPDKNPRTVPSKTQKTQQKEERKRADRKGGTKGQRDRFARTDAISHSYFSQNIRDNRVTNC